jgi:Flp pilus assembly protein TadD
MPQAVSNDDISTNEIMQEIEKTLLFSDTEKTAINFDKNKDSKKNSSINLTAGLSNQNPAAKPLVDIAVAEPIITSLDIREKERLAYNAIATGQYEVAIELYKNVIEAESDNGYAKFALAVVYQKIGQTRQSKVLYYQLLKDNNGNKEEIIGNLLSILVEESPRDAIYLLSRLVAQNPKSAYIAAQASIAYGNIKNYDRAIEVLQRAVALDPERLDYKYNLAVIYDQTASYDKALEMYSEVSKNYDENDKLASAIPIYQIRNRIESIKNKI